MSEFVAEVEPESESATNDPGRDPDPDSRNPIPIEMPSRPHRLGVRDRDARIGIALVLAPAIALAIVLAIGLVLGLGIVLGATVPASLTASVTPPSFRSTRRARWITLGRSGESTRVRDPEPARGFCGRQPSRRSRLP